MGGTELTLFGHLVRKSGNQLGVEQAALLVAEGVPGLDVSSYVRKLDKLAAVVRRRLSLQAEEAGVSPVKSVLAILYKDLGFRGNTENFYDPGTVFLMTL